MPNDDKAPSLHERLVASLIQLQASFVLTPEFTWRDAVQQIEFEAVKIHELFEAEFGGSREVAELVEHLLVGTEFASLDLDSKVRALYQDWVDTNREFAIVAAARDNGRGLIREIHDHIDGLNLTGDGTMNKVADLVRRYRENYTKVVELDVQSTGLSRELTEARARILRLEQERDEWKGRIETQAQTQLNSEDDKALLDHLLREVDPLGTYRDSLEERLANPLRQRLGLPRRFEHIPAPDCKKVQTRSGATYLHEGSRWVCTFAPFGNGESREQTGASWSQSEMRNFAPFVEVLINAEQRSDS